MRMFRSTNLDKMLNLQALDNQAFGYPIDLYTLRKRDIIQRSGVYMYACDDDFYWFLENVKPAELNDPEVEIVDEEEVLENDKVINNDLE